MPYTQQLNCNEETVSRALLAHKEKVGEIYLNVQDQIANIKIKAEELVEDFTDPAKIELAKVLAPTGKSVDTMVTELGLMNGTSKTDIETNLNNRYGISVVNGRLLVPGNTDLLAIKELYRLLESIDAIEALIPELASININDKFNVPTIQPRFIAIFTKEERTKTESEECKEAIVTDTETILGIDTPISSITYTNNIGREELIANIFWIGSPEVYSNHRNKARKLGFTDDEFISIVTTEGIQNYDGDAMTIRVYTVYDPYITKKLENNYGDDAEDILSRGPEKLNLAPTTGEVFDEAKKILGKRAGAKTNKGAKDYASGPTSMMQVIDVSKTFDPDQKLEYNSNSDDPCFSDLAGLGETLSDGLNDAQNFMGDVLSAVGAPQKALNELIAGLSGAASGALNELTSILGTVNNTLGDPDFLKCFFGASFSIDLEFGNILGPLDSLLDLLENGIDLVLEFLDLISDALAAIGQLACIQAAISGGITGSLGAINTNFAALGISCVLDGPELDKCIQEIIDAAELAADFSWNLLAAALNSIRILHRSLASLSFSIRGNIATNAGTTCNPAETALLTALLAEKKIAMDEILSL